MVKRRDMQEPDKHVVQPPARPPSQDPQAEATMTQVEADWAEEPDVHEVQPPARPPPPQNPQVEATMTEVDASGKTDSGCIALMAWNEGTLPGTNWDEHWTREAPGGNYLLGAMNSWHDNGKEDRVWTIQYKKFHVGGMRNWASPGWRTWGNDWDRHFEQECGGYQVMTGITTYHDNKKEDRRWAIKCGTVDANGEGQRWWTHTLNGWDAHMYLDSSAPAQLLVGMKSWHDNGKEDRLFQFRFTSYTKC